jgi:hypothetical protein
LTRARCQRPDAAIVAAILVTLAAPPARAQMTPAAGHTPPDDTPNVRIGGTLFLDYTFTSAPKATDAAGHSIHANAFQLGRSYINVTGQVHHLLSFRITPDIFRETGSGSALNGSYVFQVKYAFAQLNLDDWLPRGSWIRLGLQQTPYVDYAESVYRYRFQGTIFAEREGFLTSSDAAVSFHTNFPSNRGDLHVGIYNGDGFRRFEANDRKALQIRGTWRPVPLARTLRGLRLTAFYDADAYVKDGTKRRFIGDIGFEHPRLHAGFVFVDASDQTLPTAPKVDARGFSLWATPRTRKGIEGLLRYDRFEPNRDDDDRKTRGLVGIAYWLPATGAQAAFLLDFEKVTYKNFAPARPTEQRIALHCLVNF